MNLDKKHERDQAAPGESLEDERAPSFEEEEEATVTTPLPSSQGLPFGPVGRRMPPRRGGRSREQIKSLINEALRVVNRDDDDEDDASEEDAVFDAIHSRFVSHMYSFETQMQSIVRGRRWHSGIPNQLYAPYNTRGEVTERTDAGSRSDNSVPKDREQDDDDDQTKASPRK